MTNFYFIPRNIYTWIEFQSFKKFIWNENQNIYVRLCLSELNAPNSKTMFDLGSPYIPYSTQYTYRVCVVDVIFFQTHFQQRSFIVSRIIDSSVNIQWILLWPHEITFLLHSLFLRFENINNEQNAERKKYAHTAIPAALWSRVNDIYEFAYALRLDNIVAKLFWVKTSNRCHKKWPLFKHLIEETH